MDLSDRIKVIILMGVSGCGKTTIGTRLSEITGYPFIEGDDYHPPANIDKMSNGIPLSDDDRGPWLIKLHNIITEHTTRKTPLILSCSALKEKYRRLLMKGNKDIVFVYLRGNFDVIKRRLQERREHYMKAEMLQSQFDALEEPSDAAIVDVYGDIDGIVREIINKLEYNEQ